MFFTLFLRVGSGNYSSTTITTGKAMNGGGRDVTHPSLAHRGGVISEARAVAAAAV